jgi:hypothetical protein
VKFGVKQPVKAQGGYSSTLSLTLALDGEGGGFKVTARPLNPTEETRFTSYRRLGAENPAPTWIRSPNCPTRSDLLHRPAKESERKMNMKRRKAITLANYINKR